MPGIASNLLADRLRSLEQAGVIERAELPPPAASTVYRVTERGRGLVPVIVELAVWGAPLLESGRGEDHFFGRWMTLLEVAVFRGISTAGVAPLLIELRVDGEAARLDVREDGVAMATDHAGVPDVVFVADAGTAARVLMRDIEVEDAVAQGLAGVIGDPDAAGRLRTLIGRVDGFRSSTA